MTDLVELSKGLDTDKGTRHSYLEVYQDLFKHMWSRPLTILEVGVADGGSLQLWQMAFPFARVIGVDNRKYDSWVGRGLEVILGDATKESTFSGVEGLDVVIDDGSHIVADQQRTYSLLLPRMVGDWVYVIEDLQEQSIPFFSQRGWEVIDRRSVKGTEDDILAIRRGR